MSKYINVKVHVSDGQKDNIARAVQSKTGVSIKLSHEDLTGDHVIAVTQSQANKMAQAYENGKGMVLKLSKTQLMHNSKIEGGFIGAILPFLATAGKFLLSSVLPSLATGLLSGVGSAAGSKVVDKIAGNGIVYVKKGGQCCKIVQQGNGMYLQPYSGMKMNNVGEGLWMKSGQGFVDGSGLLLGENSPFKNIPLLGMIL